MTTKNLSILLIDDDDNDNFFHERAIKKSGLDSEVRTCVSGYDALDYLQNKGKYESLRPDQCKPDLIFLDINMPRLNGWEFLEAYAALPDEVLQKTSIVIVMLSTSTHSDSHKRALATPYVTNYIEKPLQADTLLDLVKKYFSNELET